MQKILTSEEVIEIYNLAFGTSNIYHNKQNNSGTLTNIMISLSAVQNVLFYITTQVWNINHLRYTIPQVFDRLIAYALHYVLRYNRVTRNYESQLMLQSH